MAGAIPGSTIQTNLLRVMGTEDVAYIADGFLEKAKQTADTCCPPAGVKAFLHFWRIASNYTTEREDRKDSAFASRPLLRCCLHICHLDRRRRHRGLQRCGGVLFRGAWGPWREFRFL